MNFVVEFLGAVLSRVAGWLLLSGLLWVLRLVGKGLGAMGGPVLAFMGARRMEAEAPAAPAIPPGTLAVTCPACGASVVPGPFCPVCGRALPAT
jgi:hypothetical protein